MLSSCVLFLIAAGVTGTTTTTATEALPTHGVFAVAQLCLANSKGAPHWIAGGLQTALWLSQLGGI